MDAWPRRPTARGRRSDALSVLPPVLRAALPTLITMGRLLAVPVAVWLILSGRMTAAFWLFVAAAVSDALDGFFARRFQVRSLLGSYLDPLADKVLLVSVYLTLGQLGHVAIWLVIMVVFRDLLILGGALLYLVLGQSLQMQPLLISKLNTMAQLLLPTVVLARLGLGFDDAGVGAALVYVVAATTLASGGAYLAIWGWRILRLGAFK